MIEVLRLVDPNMAHELSQVGDLIASNPFAYGTRAYGSSAPGKQHAVRVRDGIVFQLLFHLEPRQSVVVIKDVEVTGPTPP